MPIVMSCNNNRCVSINFSRIIRPLVLFNFYLREFFAIFATIDEFIRPYRNKGNKKLKFTKVKRSNSSPVFSMPDTYSHPSFIVDPRVATFFFVLSLKAHLLFPGTYNKFPWTLVCDRRLRGSWSLRLLRIVRARLRGARLW